MKEIMNTEMIVDYEASMLDEMLRLFYNTVHTVNAKDYDSLQLDTWAPLAIDKEKWKLRLANNICKVSIRKGEIVGFGELSEEGGIDTMFVHAGYQGEKIGTRILKKLTDFAHDHHINVLTTDASITARPFFERNGFSVVREQKNHYKKIVFINYKMSKRILP